MSWLDKLDSPGGHVAICFAAMLFFAGLQALGCGWAHDPLMQAQGAVYLAIQLKRRAD